MDNINIEERENFKKAQKRTFKYLSYRERSEKEVRDYLNRKDFPNDVIDAIIIKFKEWGYLNNERFARLWVQSRANSGRRGPILVKKELQNKGISSSLIEGIISEEYDSGREHETAYNLLQKRIRRYQDEEFQKLKIRLSQYLQRKGFRYYTIKRVVDEVLNCHFND